MPTTKTTVVSGADASAGNIHASAFHNADGDLVTMVSNDRVTAGAPDGKLKAPITCQGSDILVKLGALSSKIIQGATVRLNNVSWRVDGTATAFQRLAEAVA